MISASVKQKSSLNFRPDCFFAVFFFSHTIAAAPAAEMIKKACNLKKAASDSKQTVATLSADKLREIAEYKMPDLNANDIEAAMRIVAGTARNMGVKCEGLDA